ncbi:hypothetical protein RBH29_03915 [Herbivorax sp. ANBcel31]|uniref:hypothetical protein n=1 Tax=Herbivorax sp. ANBcel31 TaxID=3069754 RepID=UPI0027B2BB02|nr:hypothetical protein [Herbivorax sp. ANBcel31]MDQ2085579.1 hypothetical protein [Herbivorax sp. ANBcel31]
MGSEYERNIVVKVLESFNTTRAEKLLTMGFFLISLRFLGNIQKIGINNGHTRKN